MLERVQRLEDEQRRILAMVTSAPPAFTFAGPWLSTAEGAAYVCCATVNAFREWKRRHHIVSRANGSVAKADLDRALRLKRKTRRGTHANTLANLRAHHARGGRR